MIRAFIAALLVATAHAASPTGEPSGQPSGEPSGEPSGAPTVDAGITLYQWPKGTADVAYSTPVTVTDPIGTNNDVMRISTSNSVNLGTITYVGIWLTATTPSSHVEQATGGPITKVTCSVGATTCDLPLYQNANKMNPIPAGTYTAYAVDGTDLNYGTATKRLTVSVTVNPYISAWGSTLQQSTGPNVERGSDIKVTWSGLATGDVITLSKGTITTQVKGCPVDMYTISAAEAALGGGTISLKTAEATRGGTGVAHVSFANIGSHDIKMYDLSASTTLDWTTDPCTHTAAATLGVTRTVTVIDSDTVYLSHGVVTGVDAEAGQDIRIHYNFVSGGVSAGTYFGLFPASTIPSSHSPQPTGVAGYPVAVVYLPTGATSGVVNLTVPVVTASGAYIMNVFNSNDPGSIFTTLADTSYSVVGKGGYQDSGIDATYKTDVTVIASPTGEPTGQPSGEPSGEPSGVPTSPSGQPTGIPTSSPSFVEEPWGEYVWTEKRHRKAGMCENQCSGHGTCEVNGNCKCFKGLDGEAEWTGPDCSQRTCPFDFAWVGSSINSNNLHPWAQCSNKGICNADTGECECFTGYEGAACQRTVCPDNCNDQGTCWPEKHLASKAGRVYDSPWDSMKHVGCLCDPGYRGPACDQQECPSGADPLSGYGNESGRDCSGRGICDYSNGMCACFTGFFGTRCQHQTTVM